MSNENYSSYRFKVSETVAIACASIIGPAIALAYEVGYLRWYGLPGWLVSLNLEIILFAFSAIAFILMVARLYLGSIPNKPWFNLISAGWNLLPLGALLYIIIVHTEWAIGRHLFWAFGFIIPMAAVFLTVLIRNVIGPIVKHKDLDSWWDRWGRGLESENSIESVRDALDLALIKKLGLRSNIVVLLLPIIFIGIMQIGTSNARKQRNYLLSSGSESPCLLLRKYSEAYVCVYIDTSSNRLLGQYEILSSSRIVMTSYKTRGLVSSYDSTAGAPWFRKQK